MSDLLSLSCPPQPSHGRDGRFLSGHPGPGRPIGLRNRFSKSFLADIMASWEKHGGTVLDRLAETDPATYVRVCASVAGSGMPRARAVVIGPEFDDVANDPKSDPTGDC
ncbi:hypothetical protein BB934_22355 [Microvirga ossetica]|uniref:Uncharacterized protein n=1 Tax=Microvirga ossetica TaxID=1882682 RepID=A0A1B2ELD0_9HYPH|nr:hypothetical protein [Microvirga ossetica]ANY80632.1 hypothetical protein BB934_22355 [Microvirga ossetica]